MGRLPGQTKQWLAVLDRLDDLGFTGTALAVKLPAALGSGEGSQERLDVRRRAHREAVLQLPLPFGWA